MLVWLMPLFQRVVSCVAVTHHWDSGSSFIYFYPTKYNVSRYILLCIGSQSSWIFLKSEVALVLALAVYWANVWLFEVLGRFDTLHVVDINCYTLTIIDYAWWLTILEWLCTIVDYSIWQWLWVIGGKYGRLRWFWRIFWFFQNSTTIGCDQTPSWPLQQV